jgi:uncharacterized protein (TIGR03435 family)
MLQNLLQERFKLAFHVEQKEVPIYELSVDPKGPQMRSYDATDSPQVEELWWMPPFVKSAKDGYPVLPEGRSGVAVGSAGRHRWVGAGVSAPEIAAVLGEQLGRPVIDATGLKGRYAFDLKWVTDPNWSERDKAEIKELVGEVPDRAPGALLFRAVRDQLGLRLTAKKGLGRVVIIDHVEKAPTAN